MKKLIGAISTIAFSSSIFAYTGHGFKIIDEKITSSPGFNFKVEDMPVTEPISTVQPVSVKVHTQDVRGKYNYYSQVDGYHHITIVNKTDKPQLYAYTHKLKCAGFYSEFLRHVWVQPGGAFMTSDHTFGAVYANVYYNGSWPIIASTKLSGAVNRYDENRAFWRVGP